MDDGTPADSGKAQLQRVRQEILRHFTSIFRRFRRAPWQAEQ